MNEVTSHVHPLVDGCPPAWASGWGEDRYGVFVEFEIRSAVQRMRWIPPGRFLMGSPEDEEGRLDRERQHRVTLTSGYWVGDVPCTQALWKAVRGGGNPSEFKSDDRPVEKVNWDECREFAEKLNELIPIDEHMFRLPTEAEWEWACRAGTTTATYAGDLQIAGERNAPALHEIAWYGGNSGVDFDLENGQDSSGWPSKQFDHEKAGTRIVGQKKPNSWGLCDMLGNVREWCHDWFGEYEVEVDVTNPEGPDRGDGRVSRGGSWVSSARYVRAACR